MQKGKVYLVGAGPSDIGLLTLKGKALLERADVVIYDALVGQEILHLIPDSAEQLDVGKRAGNHPVPQQQINQLLLQKAQQGKLVVRLKGGDPFLFGRGGEELELLAAHNIPFEVVPGVTSAVAVPAYAGIPVTHRDFCSSVHIITGHTKQASDADIDYSALVKLDGTLIFLMGVAALEEICSGLLRAGMDAQMPAAVLERGTTAVQRRVTAPLCSLPKQAAKAGICAPAIIVVGRVCALADRFAWAEKRPLGGWRVLVTRPKARASRFVELLHQQGAEVLELPTIRTLPIVPNPILEQELGQLKDYQWLVFTSPAGVELFFTYLRKTRRDVRCLGEIKLAAIGPATAQALEEHGIFAALVPERYNAAALGELLALRAQKERVLLLRARDGSPDLPIALKKGGICYTDVAIYDTIYEAVDIARAAALLDTNRVDAVAFTSASTVHGFVQALGKRDYSQIRAACIGETTAQAARAYGMKTQVAKQATIPDLVELLVQMKAKEG